MIEDRNQVEIAYARTDEQTILSVEADQGLTVKEAIRRSGILRRFPEIDLRVNRVGIFGKLTQLAQVLALGDRVEIYRPLIADPKEARKKRAAQGQAMRKESGDSLNRKGHNPTRLGSLSDPQSYK